MNYIIYIKDSKANFVFPKSYGLTFNFDDGTGLIVARGAGNPTDVHSSIGNLGINDPERIPYLLDTGTHCFRVLVPFHL